LSTPERAVAAARLSFVALLVGAALALLPYASYLTDDTFIHFQFVKHLALGGGLSFNAGEPTYGMTSPLWTLLLAGLARLLHVPVAAPADAVSMPPIAWLAKACGALFHLLAIALLVRTGRRLGWSRGLSFALGALLAAHAWAERWALSGMETPLAVFCVVWAWLELAGTFAEGKGAVGAGVALGAAALARPECHLLLLLAVVALALGADRGRRRAAQALLGSLLVLVPWLITAWVSFHRLLPNTAAAKAGAWIHGGAALAALRAELQIVLATDALPLAFFVLVLALGGRATALPRDRGRRAFWILNASWTLFLPLFLAAAGVQVVSRYLLLAVPSLLLLGTASFRWVVATSFPGARRWALPAFLAWFVAQNAALTAFVSAPNAREHTTGLRFSLVALGLWARHHTPPEAVFAVPDIGAFGYYAERRVVDLYGLVTPELAPIVVREGYDAVVTQVLYEVAGRPDYLIDRHPERGRLARPTEEGTPYRFLFARAIPNLGITRRRIYYYSVYAIDWGVVDRTRTHVASLPLPKRGAIIEGRALAAR